MESFTVVGGKPTISKDPNAVLDYVLDFTEWLAVVSDTLVSVTTEAVGVVVDSAVVVAGGKKVLLWVSGGTEKEDASVKVRFTTAGGRVDDRTIYFKVKNR